MKITTIGFWGGYPAAKEATSSFLIQSNRTNILFDCGSNVLAEVQSYLSFQDLDRVIISHYHGDHFGDIYSTQHAAKVLTDLGIRKKPLHIFAYGEDQKFSTLPYGSYCIAHSIATNTPYTMDDLTVAFESNKHPVPAFSARIEEGKKSLVILTDTEWSDELVELSQEADLLICESSLYNSFYGKISGHLTAGEVGKIAAKSGAKRLVLTHLPHYGNHKELLEEAKDHYEGPVELAQSGRVWEL